MSHKTSSQVWATAGSETATVSVSTELRRTIKTLLETYQRRLQGNHFLAESNRTGLATQYEMQKGAEFFDQLSSARVRMHVTYVWQAYDALVLLRALITHGRIRIPKDQLEDLTVFLLQIFHLPFSPGLLLEPISASDDPVIADIIERFKKDTTVFLSGWEGLVFQSWLQNRKPKLSLGWKTVCASLKIQTQSFRDIFSQIYPNKKPGVGHV